ALGDLPVLDDDETRRVLHSWQSPGDAPRPLGLLELFSGVVAHTPDAPALVWEDDVVSYSELDRDAIALARRLVAAGVRVADRVAVVLPRSRDLVTGGLAVQKAGAASLPVDPAYPKARIDYLLQDSGPRVVVTTVAGQDVLPIPDGCTVLTV